MHNQHLAQPHLTTFQKMGGRILTNKYCHNFCESIRILLDIFLLSQLLPWQLQSDAQRRRSRLQHRICCLDCFTQNQLIQKTDQDKAKPTVHKPILCHIALVSSVAEEKGSFICATDYMYIVFQAQKKNISILVKLIDCYSL